MELDTRWPVGDNCGDQRERGGSEQAGKGPRGLQTILMD